MMLNAFVASKESLQKSNGTYCTSVPFDSEADFIGNTSTSTSTSCGTTETGNNNRLSSSNTIIIAYKDDPTFAKYFKMLQMGMPIDVVKHALTRDGFDPTIVDPDRTTNSSSTTAGSSSEEPVQAQTQLSVQLPVKDNPVYEKYFRMLKMGLPMDAIKNAIVRANLDPSVLDQDYNMPVQGQVQVSKVIKTDEKTTAAVATTKHPLKDDPEYSKYFRMLNMGLPIPAIKHAMVRDNVDPSIIDQDHTIPLQTEGLNKIDDNKTSSKTVDSHTSTRTRTGTTAMIPLKDDPQYSKYFRMLNMGLPIEVIKHAIAKDNLDPSIMDQDHTMPINNNGVTVRKDDNNKPPIEKKDSHRRARLHWKTLRKIASNSLWARIGQHDELAKIEIDEDEFQELFQEEKGVSTQAKKKSNFYASKRTSTVSVIDSKRAKNGAIILARIKMSHTDLADAVDRIDERSLSAEQIEKIIEYLPTDGERRVLDDYMKKSDGLYTNLGECEKFMISMMTVKYAKRKLSALLFKLQFESFLHDIDKKANLITSACLEINNSDRLRLLFGYVLTFGNRLNTAGNNGNKGQAGAFTLDSLLKLNQAKAFDKKTTFLHYIVLIVRRNNNVILDFKDDLPSVFAAEKVFWDQCVGDLDEIENELENLRKIALYRAYQNQIQVQVQQQQQEHKCNTTSSTVVKGDDDDSFSDNETSLTLEEEVEALRSTPIGIFTLKSVQLVATLRDKVDTTNILFQETLEYLGEDENDTKQPHELFNIIVSFSREFDKAKDEVLHNEKKKLREERKRQQQQQQQQQQQKKNHHHESNSKSENEHGRRSLQNPRGTGMLLKASNHQPNFSRVLKELRSKSSPLQLMPLIAATAEVQQQPSHERDNNVVHATNECRNDCLLTIITEDNDNRVTTPPVGDRTSEHEHEHEHKHKLKLNSHRKESNLSYNNSLDNEIVTPTPIKDLYNSSVTSSLGVSQHSLSFESIKVLDNRNGEYNDDTTSTSQTSLSLDVA